MVMHITMANMKILAKHVYVFNINIFVPYLYNI